MKKRIALFFLLNFLVVFTFRVNAQQEFGQIVIGAGVGYSPEFDGGINFFGSGYPVSTKPADQWNRDDSPYPSFACPSYTMNRGGSIDFGISNLFSIGIAASYQDETLVWILENNSFPGTPSSYPNSDKISRTNIALRFLYHFPVKSKIIDMYTGIRPGMSFWHDTPSPNNIPFGFSGPNGTGTPIPSTFIENSTMQVFSFQALFGAQVCVSNLVGVHVNIGIGSPYLAECGITVRINTHKASETPTK
ncbi:MAG TPA: hypothetical protein VK783_10290 [Bacteroidia bacterium]|nr:hypothetical protein [Bacteroidia bacterium]